MMTRNDGFRRFPGKRDAPAKSQTSPLKRELNHSVPLDEFDREQMGLAAKE